MVDVAEFYNTLRYYTGTESYHRSPLFPKFLWTDGVQAMAEIAHAFWLIDTIASHQPTVKKKAEQKQDSGISEFQLWYLSFNDSEACADVVKQHKIGEGQALLSCWSDAPRKGREIVFQKIEHTDFPRVKDFKLYVEFGWVNGPCHVLMLPTER